MSVHYLIVWSGGYEPNQYEVRTDKAEAIAVAEGWSQDAKEGDNIEVIEVDPETGGIYGVPWEVKP